MYAAIAHAARGESGSRILIAISVTRRSATTTAAHANGVGHQMMPTIGKSTSGSAAVVTRRNIASGDAPKLSSATRATSTATIQKSETNNATKTTSRKSVG